MAMARPFIRLGFTLRRNSGQDDADTHMRLVQGHHATEVDRVVKDIAQVIKEDSFGPRISEALRVQKRPRL